MEYENTSAKKHPIAVAYREMTGVHMGIHCSQAFPASSRRPSRLDSEDVLSCSEIDGV